MFLLIRKINGSRIDFQLLADPTFAQLRSHYSVGYRLEWDSCPSSIHAWRYLSARYPSRSFRGGGADVEN